MYKLSLTKLPQNADSIVLAAYRQGGLAQYGIVCETMEFFDPDEFDKASFLKKLGKRIKKVRRSKGYSQDRLEFEANLARGSISKIESGANEPMASTLFKISKILEIPIGKLFEF